MSSMRATMMSSLTPASARATISSGLSWILTSLTRKKVRIVSSLKPAWDIRMMSETVVSWAA